MVFRIYEFLNFFYIGHLKHIDKKSFKNIGFFQYFYNIFGRKYSNLYVFGQKVGPKQWFLQYFQGSGIKKYLIP